MSRAAPKRTTRRRAHAERAQYIDSKTDGGAMMVDYFLALANDPEADVKDRSDAHKWLAEHSTAGKPPATTEVDVHVTGELAPAALNYDALTLEEALEWRALMAKATAARSLPPAPEPVDAVLLAEDDPEVLAARAGFCVPPAEVEP